MEYQIKKSVTAEVSTGCLIVPVVGKISALKGGKKSFLKELDALTEGTVLKALQQGDLTEKAGSYLLLPAPLGLKAQRLALVYAGSEDALETKDVLKFTAGAAQVLNGVKASSAIFAYQELKLKDQEPEWLIRHTVKAVENAFYKFTQCKGKSNEKDKDKAGEKKQSLKTVGIVPPADTKAAPRALKEAKAIATGVRFTKDLGNLPGNQCTPSFLAKSAEELVTKNQKNLTVSVLNETQMKKLKMGALLSVTAGTNEPAKLIVLEYKGAKKTEKPFAFVGKGITFDSGGISLKPGAKMDEMKFDMCGAATVLGLFRTIIELKLPINVVGVIAAAENMPSGTATKPGDVVTSMSGQTIEVLNTDAEGRLVLCDALTYVAKFKPKYTVDIATLTGACVIALGAPASGLYANDDELAGKLLTAGEDSRDRAWRMPLWDDYQEAIDGKAADIANIGGQAGSITAACFLERFTRDLCWAHFDVAGTAWVGSTKRATGRPVSLLCQFLLNECA